LITLFELVPLGLNIHFMFEMSAIRTQIWCVAQAEVELCIKAAPTDGLLAFRAKVKV